MPSGSALYRLNYENKNKSQIYVIRSPIFWRSRGSVIFRSLPGVM